jgi:hypothetical protein
MGAIKVKPRASTAAQTDGGSAGRPLPPSLQHRFETQFGQDLSSVRVHEDHRATMLGATAYTQGTNIVFAPGTYQPHDPAGERLIAHELAHVAQQGAWHQVTVPAGTVEVEPPANQ